MLEPGTCNICHGQAKLVPGSTDAYDCINGCFYDPGIKQTVLFLKRNGFNTTDSGDGYSKSVDQDHLDIPHVFISVSPVVMLSESHRLSDLLENHVVFGTDYSIEATYWPSRQVSVIQLYGLLDIHLSL